MNKSKVLSGIVSVVLGSTAGISTSSAAWAEETDSNLIEEIVVTAQKRNQALADIPMSVTVLGGEQLERQQADNFQDLVALIPGLSINSSTRGVTRITLRGLNTGGVASTVGVYVGDVPFGSSSGLANGAILSGDFDTFDLARVEVLRGPQGTLYGASSLGGVLKYVPNAPSTEAFEAKVQGSVESVSGGDLGYAMTGVVNMPVTDKLAIRASGFSRSDDGFIDSIGNNPIVSLTDPGLNVVEGTRVEKNLNTLDSYGGRVSALFEPTDRLSIDLTAFMQNLESGASDVVEADPVTLRPLNDSPVQSRYHPEYTNIDYRVYSATVDWDMGGATLQSVSSYGKFNQDFQRDLAIANGLVGADFAAFLTFAFGDPVDMPLSSIQRQVTSTDKFSQELRLVSPDSDTFEWLLGAYYTAEDSGIDPQNLYAVDAGTENVVVDLANISLTSTFDELALFANATWYVSPNFELSFGGRTSKNEQVASQVLDGPLVGGLTAFDDAKSSESPFTYSIAPRFKLSDNSSLYARVATGYRPGGPNVLPPGVPADTPKTYDSDSLTSYEAGYKVTGEDGTFSLEVAAFYLDWQDIQLYAVINSVGVNANGGTAASKGLEFAAEYLPLQNLRLSMNGAYTDAKLTADTDPIVGGLNGDPLSYVPELSLGLAGEYEWQVMGDSTAYVGGNLSYVGDRPAEFSNRDADGNIREAESYVTLGLRAGIDFGKWYLELYAKNLTDEMGINSIDANGFQPNGAVGLSMIRPRTIGMSVGARF